MSAALTLEAELEELQTRIRADAANPKLRVHLFQLLCVMGRWERALAQLQLCAQMDARAIPMAQTYREAIRAERFREEVFAGRRQPSVLGMPPAWIGSMIEALRLEAIGEAAKGRALRAQALEAAEPIPFRVDGTVVEWFCDGDSRLGPSLEVVANGQYYWVPVENIEGLQLEAPSDLRDLVWATGELRLPNGGRLPVLIPARYPETAALEGEQSDALKRSRATRWVELGDDQWRGEGQRMWVSDAGEHAVLDVRLVERVASSETAATV
ncbi:MAG: virulence protein SciE type [Casimicrobiaceae bacterium]|nr:virulence protein SciE type [Casimicrobiaceae bacterium]MDW8311725.1 type VI secretion system accessory protein TagJ [Burkholderiales bacterium]